MQIQPIHQRVPSPLTLACSLLSLLLVAGVWLAIFMEGHDSARWTVVLVTAGIGETCTLFSILAFTRGNAGVYFAVWSACGIFAGIALPTLFSVGSLFVLAVILSLVAIAHIPSMADHPWWHPRSMVLGYLAFAVTLVALLVA